MFALKGKFHQIILTHWIELDDYSSWWIFKIFEIISAILESIFKNSSDSDQSHTHYCSNTIVFVNFHNNIQLGLGFLIGKCTSMPPSLTTPPPIAFKRFPI